MLDIHVEAEPESMQTLADWLIQQGRRTDKSSQHMLNALGSSESWQGEAGEGFRAIAEKLRRDSVEMTIAYDDAGEAVQRHARDIAAVRDKMNDARDIATKAGLIVTDHEIHGPGPAPDKPNAYTETDSGAEVRAKADAWDAWHAYTAKAKAYAKCVALVTEARNLEQDSQSLALSALEGVADKPVITSTNFLTGIAAGYVTRQQNWRTVASSFSDLSADAAHAARNAGHGAPSQAKNLVTSLIAQARSETATAKANNTKIGRALEKLPKQIQETIKADLGRFIPKNSKYLVKAPALLKRVPVVGTGITAASVVSDVVDGRDVAKSVGSNGVGLVSGTAIGMAAGGPAGAAAGFIVGTGASIVTDNMMTLDPNYTLAPEAPKGYNAPNAPK